MTATITIAICVLLTLDVRFCTCVESHWRMTSTWHINDLVAQLDKKRWTAPSSLSVNSKGNRREASQSEENSNAVEMHYRMAEDRMSVMNIEQTSARRYKELAKIVPSAQIDLQCRSRENKWTTISGDSRKDHCLKSECKSNRRQLDLDIQMRGWPIWRRMRKMALECHNTIDRSQMKLLKYMS